MNGTKRPSLLARDSEREPTPSCRIRYAIVNNRHKQAIMEPVAGITDSSVLPPLVSPVLSLVF